MLKLAWFSLLNENSNSKSASFTRSLMPYLEKNFLVDYFVDAEIVDNKKIFHYLRALPLHAKKNYDCFVYQIEDTPEVTFIQRHQALFPGITIFHDLNLNALYLEKHRHESSSTLLNREMDELFGESSARLGDYLIKSWPLGIFDSIYVRSKQEIENSTCAVVQNETQRNYFVKYNSTEAQILPSAAYLKDASAASSEEKLQGRENLGFSEKDFIITFSESTELKDRLHYLVEVLTEIVEKDPLLLCIAKNNKELCSYQRFFEKIKVPFRFRIIETNNDLDFLLKHLVGDLHFAATNDLLRGMPLASSSCFAQGIPLVVANLSWAKELPNNSCFKINLGLNETKELVILIKELLENKTVLIEVSENAKKYALDFWNPQIIFKNLQQLIEKNCFKLKNLSKERIQKYVNSKSKIIAENSLNE